MHYVGNHAEAEPSGKESRIPWRVAWLRRNCEKSIVGCPQLFRVE